MPFGDPLNDAVSILKTSDRVQRHADRTGLDPDLIKRVVTQESGGKSNAKSWAGAGGTMQLMPGTAKQYGVTDVNDPEQNVRAGTDYLKDLMGKFGDPYKALAAYNAGEGAVTKHGYEKVRTFSNFPKGDPRRGGYEGSTGAYVDKILKGYEGTGYQDPLNDAVRTLKPSAQKTTEADPLSDAVSQLKIPKEAPQGRGAGMARAAAQGPQIVLRRRPKGPMGITSGAGGEQEGIMPQIGGEPSLKKILPRSAGTSTPISPLRQQAAQNVRNLTFDPVANVKSLVRAVTGNEVADVNEEEQRLTEQQARANTPEMIAARKDVGSAPALVRGGVSAAQRFGGGLIKELAGIADAGSIVSGLGPIADEFGVNPIPKIKDYLNRRGSVLEESASMPMNAQGQAIERGLPEKATDAVASLGLTVAQLVLLKKATGLNLAPLMAIETALKTSDLPLKDRAPAAAESYAMGRILDTHLSRPMSAVAFGGPTAVQSGLQVAQGNKSLEDALLETGVQAGAGAILGGKTPEAIEPTQTVPDALQGKLRGSEIDQTLAAREAAVKPVTDAQGNVLLNPDEVARGEKPKIKLANSPTPEPAHLANFRDRASDGTFVEGTAKIPDEFKPENVVAPTEPAASQPTAIPPTEAALPATASQPKVSPEGVAIDAGIKPPQITSSLDLPSSSGEKGRQGAFESSVAQEPWQMTRDEYSRQAGEVSPVPSLRTVHSDHRTEVTREGELSARDEEHRVAVEQAFKRGEKVSPEVLKDYPWLAAREAIKPYVKSLRGLSDKELKAEAKKTTNDLNAWANKTPGLVNGRVNPELGRQAGFEVSEKMNAVDREIEARKTSLVSQQGATPLEAASTSDRVAFLTQKLSDMGAADATIANTPAERLAAINDTRKELERAKAEAKGQTNAIETGQRPQDNLEQYQRNDRVRTSAQPSNSGGVEQRTTGAENQAEAAPQISGERQFPKTLESTGREGGTDRTYQIIGDKEAVSKANERIAKDPEAARTFALGSEANPDSPKGKERIATGLTLADQLSREAEKATDKVEAATKHAQAAELYTKLSTDLTEAGQTVQAASLARKYSPVGAPLEVARIAKAQGVTPKAEDISAVREMAKRQDDLEGRIADIQKQIEEFKVKGTQAPTVKSTRAKIPTLVDRLSTMESEARARLEARKSATIKKGTGGGSAIPLDIADYSIIGAAKLARGGLNFASWSAEMVKEFGEEIRPQLNKIFLASHKSLTEQRVAMKEESAQRGATKAGQSLEDFKQQRYELQVQKRQIRMDLDRKFNELEKRNQRGPIKKASDAVASVLTNSLLSYHGLLNILSTMTAKEVINTGLRVPESVLDIGYTALKGGSVPRASAGLSLRGTGRAAKSLVTEAPRNVAKAFMGKPSEVMPRVHEGPTDNAGANLALDFMSRHYASKEALTRTPVYNLERSNQASIMAKNDVADGIIKKSEVAQRENDYLNGRATADGPLNQKYVASLADQAADYEIKSKNPTASGRITPSAKAARVKELSNNPTQLIDSLALQYADKEVYANPLGPKMQKVQDALNAGGPIPKALIQPFFKRPVNAFNDLAYSYTGAKGLKEGGQAIYNAIKGQEWTPAERQSFNRAAARGSVVYSLFALGSALAAHGMLTSGNDKNHPGALKWGNSYYAIGNKPVIGWAIVAGATYQIDGAKAVPGAIGKMVLDHPLLKGLKNVSDATQEGAQAAQTGNTSRLGKTATSFAGKTIGRVIPTPIAAAAETLDTQNRDTRGILGPFKARVPFVREGLPATGAKERGSAFDPFLGTIPLKPRSRGAFKF